MSSEGASRHGHKLFVNAEMWPASSPVGAARWKCRRLSDAAPDNSQTTITGDVIARDTIDNSKASDTNKKERTHKERPGGAKKDDERRTKPPRTDRMRWRESGRRGWITAPPGAFLKFCRRGASGGGSSEG